MANEAHSGLARSVRTREIGVRMIEAAHQAGVRRLAIEALPYPPDGSPGPVWSIPPGWGGYLAQPDMRKLMTTALGLGWSLWAYEADEAIKTTDPAELPSLNLPTSATASRPATCAGCWPSRPKSRYWSGPVTTMSAKSRLTDG
jgi:hypothetical protein